MSEVLLSRLRSQFESYAILLGGVDPETLAARPRPGTWSGREHLAHLGRYHEVFLERVARIGEGEDPGLGRYRAEEDERFQGWVELDDHELWAALRSRRAALESALAGLSAQDWRRSGVHPAFGRLSLAALVHFFLVHEGHHLYAAFRLCGKEP